MKQTRLVCGHVMNSGEPDDRRGYLGGSRRGLSLGLRAYGSSHHLGCGGRHLLAKGKREGGQAGDVFDASDAFLWLPVCLPCNETHCDISPVLRRDSKRIGDGQEPRKCLAAFLSEIVEGTPGLRLMPSYFQPLSGETRQTAVAIVLWSPFFGGI